MRYLIFLFMGLGTFVGAQDIASKKEELCAMPGVTNKSPGKGLVSEYRVQSGFQMQDTDGQSQQIDKVSSWNFKLKIPIVLKPSLTVLAGVNYQNEEYDFSRSSLKNSNLLFSRLNGTDLKMTRMSLYLTKSLNEKFYLGVMSDIRFSGDYSSLSQDLDRFASYKGTVALGYKPEDDREYGLGVLYANGLNRTIVLPVVYANRTFNDRWGMELVLPVKLKARYNFSPKSLLLVGSDFRSRTYSINASNEGEYLYNFRRNSLSFNATYQQNIKSWIWCQVQAGYDVSFRNRIDDLQSGQRYNLSQGSAPFVSFGVFLSPCGN